MVSSLKLQPTVGGILNAREWCQMATSPYSKPVNLLTFIIAIYYYTQPKTLFYLPWRAEGWVRIHLQRAVMFAINICTQGNWIRSDPALGKGARGPCPGPLTKRATVWHGNFFLLSSFQLLQNFAILIFDFGWITLLAYSRAHNYTLQLCKMRLPLGLCPRPPWGNLGCP